MTFVPTMRKQRHIYFHISLIASHLGINHAVFHANDTDVFKMCLYFVSRINGLQQCLVWKDVFIPAQEIAVKLSDKSDAQSNQIFTSLLLRAYILTGCDTVSYTFRKSVRTTLKALIEKTNAVF